MFDVVVSELSERYGLGDRARELFGLLMGYIFNDRRGGFGGFVESFREQGHGDLVNAWLGNPASDQALNAGDVGTVFGQGLLNDWSNRLGTSRATLAAAIAGVLPRLVAELTPGGRLPGGVGTVIPYERLPAGDRRSDQRERGYATSPAVREPRDALNTERNDERSFETRVADPSAIDPALSADARVVETRVFAPAPELRAAALTAGVAPSYDSLRASPGSPSFARTEPALSAATTTAAAYAAPTSTRIAPADGMRSRADAMAAAMASPAELAPDSAANWQFRHDKPRKRRGGRAVFWFVILLLLAGAVYYAWWSHLLDPYIAQLRSQLN